MSKQLWNTPLISTIKSDKFDLDDWLKISAAFPKVEKANERAAADFCGQPVQDSFFALKAASPQFNDPMTSGLTPLAEIIKRGMDTPEWASLHDSCVGDLVASAVGAHGFVEGVLRNLPNEVKEQAQKAQEMDEKAQQAESQLQELLDAIEMLKELGKDEKAEELEGEAQQLADQIQGLEQAAGDTASQALEAIEAYGPQIKAAANSAAKEAREEAQEVSALVKSYSLAAGGDPSHIDPATAASAMRVMGQNKNLKELAEMLGWAKKTVRAEWRKSPKGHTTLTGYQTHDLQPAKMASSEYVAMVSDNEAVSLDWQRRAADSAISHRHYAGDEKSGRGEMIIVRDESESMAGASHALAVALEWALLEVARRDKREFVSIPFSGPNQYHSWRAPKAGQMDAASLEAHLGHFYNGGTEPYQPITQALDEIASNGLRADVLIITDDTFSQPTAEFLNRIKTERSKRPLKVVTVIIGGDNGVAAQFSDKVICLTDLLRDREQLREAIAGVL